MSITLIIANLPELLALAMLIVMSGIISAGETALFSLNRQQLNRLRGQKSRVSATIIRLREHPADLLSTVLLSNISINILLYSILGVTVASLGGGSTFRTAIFAIGGFLFVLIFAEILPKLVALAVSDRLAPIVARPLRVLEIVTSPVRWLMNSILIEPLTRIITIAPAAAVDEDDLQRLINIGRNEGLLDDGENVLLHQMLDLKHLRVSALMTPRVDVAAHDLADSREELVRLFKAHRLLRVPVYDGDIDNVRGVVAARDVLLNAGMSVAELIRPVHFIPEQAGSEALLKHFRETHSQFAVVVDEYGGLAGVVALEDVVEAIVGDLRAPEENADFPVIVRMDDLNYIVDAGMDVGDFCQAFELPNEETRIHTVGGLIAERLDRLPEPRDAVVISHATLSVLGMRRRRVMRVMVRLDRPIRDNPDLSILLKHAEGAPPPRISGDGSAEAGGGSI